MVKTMKQQLKSRIPFAEEISNNENSANPVQGKPANKQKLVKKIQELKNPQADSFKFETIEEYIADGIAAGTIQKDSGAHNDDLIHIKGLLVIDGSKVKRGDWSYVVADSAKIVGEEENSPIIEYHYLPQTRFGVTTKLQAKNAAQFVKHNAFGRYKSEGDKINVEGILRIPNNTPLPNLGNVRADEVFWYPSSDYKVDIEELPSANKAFYGISSQAICSNQPKLAKRAEEKKIGKSVCKELAKREQGSVSKWLKTIKDKFKLI